MTVITTSSATSTTTPTSSTSASQSALSGNMNTFLTMLTTQLKNQDPMSPMDTSQFTQQLTQFSQVEQSINTNTKLDTLIQAQQSGQMVSAQGLVGHTVQFSGNSVGLTNGQAQFSYTMPANAVSSLVTITNAQNQVIYSAQGSTGAGTHPFTWNGATNTGGTAPDGSYTVNVQAADSTGAPVTSTVVSSGVVSAVEMLNGVVNLDAGGMTQPIANVTSILN